ncbi:uncharacterized protein G2W53_041831 [Senna tora]|uniref:Uncharacterized protein n=1 Tax=Senna tora TaxID=362788 RepID=A0A834SEE0_9FABA|nr:uncharacterized protein G2W53_041831 [Senna tora]
MLHEMLNGNNAQLQACVRCYVHPLKQSKVHSNFSQATKQFVSAQASMSFAFLPHDEKRNEGMERMHLGGRNRRPVTERGRVVFDDRSLAVGVASEEDAWCQLSDESKLQARLGVSLLKDFERWLFCCREANQWRRERREVQIGSCRHE